MALRDDETVRIAVAPPAIGEMRCDAHGRGACPFCNAPLRVDEWAEMHRLIEEIEREARENRLPPLYLFGVGFCLVMFGIAIGGAAVRWSLGVL